MGCGAVQNPQASQPGPNIAKQLYNKNNLQTKNPSKRKLSAQYLDKSQQKVTLDQAYEIKQLLGKGTYGQVYRCIKPQTQQQFALKIVKLNAKNKQQAKRHVNNLKSQISVLKKLNHPNIIKYFSFNISPDNQKVQIVFQLIENGSLKDYIDRNGTLAQGEASRICRQILEGLDYLHEKSIMHRDLKCANILLTKEGVVKITDFGTAKEIKVKTNEDIAKLCASLKGTPYYMAPQILKRSGHHKSADIWSFGCTLIQMLTGKAPWTTLTSNFQEIISYIISGIHPPLPPNITKQCQFFIQSCLDSVPSQRLTARELLNHRFILMNFKNTSPSLVYEKMSPKNENKSVKSNRTKKKVQEIEVMDLNSIQITRRKKSTLEQLSQEGQTSYQKSRYSTNMKKDKARNTNLLLDTPKYSQNSQPFLNYYGKTKNQQIEVSQPYIPMKKSNIKSAKRTSNPLKKMAKTAGHVKMTQYNLLDWNQIQRQQISNQNNPMMKNYSDTPTSSIGNTRTMQNTNNFRSNTEITEVDQEPDEIINTALAKQQRDIYMENQKILKQQKQIQRRKWQEQLKREGQITRKDISHQYIKGNR